MTALKDISAARQSMLMVIVSLAALFSCCSPHGYSDDASDSSAVEAIDSLRSENDISVDAGLWADSIMDGMTIEEMAGQLVMPAVYSDISSASMRLLRQYAADGHVGGVVLLKGTVSAARTISDTLKSMLAVPPFIAIDAEWGLAMRLDGTPEFPRNGRISPLADETVMFDYGFELARECREVGVNMVLGPVLDVLPSGQRRSGIGTRSFGRDARRVASLGIAYAKGVEAGRVLTVAKHFPGHGSADADSHKRLPVVAKTREELEASDLLPFRDYIGNGLSAMMTGHLFVPALDVEEEPVTVSRKILVDFVRHELGFDGLIVTDAINMAGAGGCSAVEAIMAGADIVLAPSNTEEELRDIVDAVRGGLMSMDVIRDRVRRVLFYKYMIARDTHGSGNIGDVGEAERIIKLLR